MSMQPTDRSCGADRAPSEQLESNSGFWASAAKTGVMALSLFSFEAARESVASERPAAITSGLTLDLAQLSMPAGFAKVEPERPAVVIPAGVERIAPNAEVERWMDLQNKLSKNSLAGEGNPRLVNGTTFLSPTAEAGLKPYVGKRQGGLSFEAVDENGYKFAFVNKSGEKWYVAESPYYKDQFPRGTPFAETSLELYKAGSECMIQKEFFSRSVFKNGNLNFDKAAAVMKAAEESRENERRDPAGVRSYKLTSNPIGYIGLVDGTASDPIMAGLIADVRHFPRMLNSLKGTDGKALYNLVSRDGSDYLTVDSSPKELLRTHIQAMHDKGIRTFYLNLAGHGNETGIFFSSNTGHHRLSPADLHSVFSEFKDCDFVVDTVACYGGGMAEEMKAYKDPSDKPGRVFMKLQAKPYSYNQEGRIEGEAGINGAPKVHSSYYQIFNAHYLMQGLGFGEAHYQADLAAKRLIPCDAEGWLSNRNGGQQTAKGPQQERRETAAP